MTEGLTDILGTTVVEPGKIAHLPVDPEALYVVKLEKKLPLGEVTQIRLNWQDAWNGNAPKLMILPPDAELHVPMPGCYAYRCGDVTVTFQTKEEMMDFIVEIGEGQTDADPPQ